VNSKVPEAASVSEIRRYWDAHTLGLQFVDDAALEPGSREFFEHIRPWMSPFRFPWLMERIEHNARLLAGRRLLEIGCGMGFVSLEFMKRGVQVTATDLTESAVELARRLFELEGVEADEVRVENALELSLADESFDAVWSNGVFHATGDPARAVAETRRVLKPGGRAIISHFYRKPSWMYYLSHFGRENIEFKEEDPPENLFMTEREVLGLFEGFRIEQAVRDHYRVEPVARRGWKATLFRRLFVPAYNVLPAPVVKPLAYKFSVIAVKV
jgi:ubiquinone/menaquinone biosynthesis C-methylase UbiE